MGSGLSLNNFREYINNRIYNPEIYVRNFDQDLPTKTLPVVKKVALLVLPFLSLHKPFGTAISLTMSGSRAFTHLNATIQAQSTAETLINLKDTTLAIVGLAATIFNFQAGLLLTTLVDTATNLSEAITHIQAGDKYKAAEALIQTSTSLLYMSFMLSGTPHIMLATIFLQASLSFYQAALELKKGKERYPEALAKLLMGIVRLKQGYDYNQTIKKRNALLKLEALKNLLEKIKKGADVTHLKNSPLLQSKSDVIMTDGDGKEYNFGTHYHGLGKGLVKGMNLQVRTTHVDGKNMKDIDFKVNHAFRTKIESLVEEMKILSLEETRDFLSSTQSHAKGIKIEKTPFRLCEETNVTIGKAHKITIEGLGNLFIGASPDYPSLYNTVRAQIEDNKTLFDLHEMLSFLDLDDALRESTPEDIERLKLGHLFRIFYPKEATQLERQAKFFELPLQDLRAEMTRQVPEMKQTMDRFLGKMELSEILPGRVRYSLPDISKMAYDLGARALITTITEPDDDDNYEVTCHRLASILKMGMLSNETRYRNGMVSEGLNGFDLFKSGGADSVYTQLLTKDNFEKEMRTDRLYEGDVRILFSLDALNSGTYQYHEANFGVRNLTGQYSKHYPIRPNIFNFITKEQESFDPKSRKPFDCEVNNKERISSIYVQKILVPDQEVADYQIKVLREKGLVKQIDGVETVLNIPLSEFIVIGKKLTKDLIK